MRYGFYRSGPKEKPNSSEVTMKEYDDHYQFKLKKPGYVKDDFNFNISKNKLVVTTQKFKGVDENHLEEKKAIKHSYCYPSAFFKMEIQLPDDIDKDQFLFDYRDGVLTFGFLKLKILS